MFQSSTIIVCAAGSVDGSRRSTFDVCVDHRRRVVVVVPCVVHRHRRSLQSIGKMPAMNKASFRKHFLIIHSCGTHILSITQIQEQRKDRKERPEYGRPIEICFLIFMSTIHSHHNSGSFPLLQVISSISELHYPFLCQETREDHSCHTWHILLHVEVCQ